MARCVLPVLVGPSTAVTPAPGARSEPNEAGEGETAISCKGFLAHFATAGTRLSPLILSLRTSLERKAPESLTPPGFRFVHRNISGRGRGGDTRSSLEGRTRPSLALRFP